jgi:hypothetical protein
VHKVIHDLKPQPLLKVIYRPNIHQVVKPILVPQRLHEGEKVLPTRDKSGFTGVLLYFHELQRQLILHLH